MKQYAVKIVGLTSLLQHRFPMAEAKNKEKGQKRSGVPEWKLEGEKAAYKDEKGKLYEPADHLEKALAIAAKQFKISGKRGATYSKLIGSAIEVRPSAIPHLIQAYEIDSRPVRIQNARVIRYRPRLDKWELEFILVTFEDDLDDGMLKQILDHAGLYVGIGDYRPDKGGKFGKFMVTKFEILK